MSTPIRPEIIAFYRDRYDEDQRLVRSAHGQLELLRTAELVRRHLPGPPGRVLDVGGGTGVHARWLVQDGYDVHLIDPVAEHVERARTTAGCTAAVGDARSLAEGNDTADATLLLGPLYHLVDAPDRTRALTEAMRVTRPGGLVAAAAISRYAPLLEKGADGGLDDIATERITEVMQTGVHRDDPDGFTTAYLHRPEELAAELTTAGLRLVVVLGVEGPSATALDHARTEDLPDLLPSAVRCARMVEADPAMIAASPHLIGFGWV